MGVCRLPVAEGALVVVPQVQSFMRGWLCRRKWKTIVQDYICSPHAESMRKRNQIVFTMVEAESEYVHQLHVLVNGFLRPLRMAASSKRPPISHDDVSSIFLNRSVWTLGASCMKTTRVVLDVRSPIFISMATHDVQAKSMILVVPC